MPSRSRSSRLPYSSSSASSRKRFPFAAAPACEEVVVEVESLRLRAAGALAFSGFETTAAMAAVVREKVGEGRLAGTGFCQRVSCPLLSM